MSLRTAGLSLPLRLTGELVGAAPQGFRGFGDGVVLFQQMDFIIEFSRTEERQTRPEMDVSNSKVLE